MLEVAGSLKELQRVLGQCGWVRADHPSFQSTLRQDVSLMLRITGLDRFVPYNDATSPMCAMFLDGKAQRLALEKNNNYHLGRDHLRIFASNLTGSGGAAPSGG